MENIENTLGKTGRFAGIPVFLETNDEVKRLDSSGTDAVLFHDASIRERLKQGASASDLPYLWTDSFQAVYGACRYEEGFVLCGPVMFQHMSDIRKRLFQDTYQIRDEMYAPPVYTVGKITEFFALIAEIASGRIVSSQEVFKNSAFSKSTEHNAELDKAQYILTAVDEDRMHHTYQEEQRLLSYVSEGNYEKAVELQRQIDKNAGVLGSDDYEQEKNLAIVAVTLCTRAAISGGLKPSLAYKISDYHIQKLNTAGNIMDIMIIRDRFLSDITRNVRKAKEVRARAGYADRAKAYIEKHYREKIYLSDIAGMLEISESHLSRLFKAETGMNIQDYIVQTRLEFAVNLLLYSNESISRIAEYVNFPSQSYFGKVFKEAKGMTPKEYRDKYKPVEVY